MFELKPLSPAAIPAALSKAERYRLLNEPAQSQSICEDVLRADPGNHQALVTLILALSDDFPDHHARTAARALELVALLPTDYERWYYTGLVAERRGRALLAHAGPGARAAAEWLQEAMHAYERAESLRPPDNDEARLRWNACARVFNARPDLLVKDDAPSAVMSE
jgi:hypothetical protein